MDALQLLTRQHEEVEALFRAYEATGPNDLGAALEGLTKIAPTRPEPGQPSALQESEAVGPVMGAVDRMRDQIRHRVSDTSV